MKLCIRIIALSFLLISLKSIAQCPVSFHDFSADDIQGNSIEMSSFAGKKVLVVNTASYCGFTPQYTDLQTLYETYGGDNFEIVGFPANNFYGQEPHDNETISEFCESYNITFTMMSKISVSGSDIHPIYQWLTQANQNCVQNAAVQWNFQKFMINEDGSWHGYVSPSTNPLNSTITTWASSPNATSVVDLNTNALEKVKVYPSGSQINIEIDSNTKGSLRVDLYSISGQKISNLYQGEFSNQLSLPYTIKGVSRGIYIVEISGEGLLERQKIILE